MHSATLRADALVIGAGPAGSSAAIRLAQAGWRVVLVEQHAYPRQKVCGECIGAGNLGLLDELGIGLPFRRLAGAELREVGWVNGSGSLGARLPAAPGPYPFGRPLGRDIFDSLLLERARSVGVRILQPAKVRAVEGVPGRFNCRIDQRPVRALRSRRAGSAAVSAAVVIDAHGSWEAAPMCVGDHARQRGRLSPRASDLFAFKARFRGASLAPGLLPVLAFEGGYGGMVVADGGDTTIACCIRRDALALSRARSQGAPAGLAVEATLRRSCRAVREVLRHALRNGPWLSVGPLQPGIRLRTTSGMFRIGNAAGESHPLIGEGISMALHSAKLLAGELLLHPAAAMDARGAMLVQCRYSRAWHEQFAHRLRLAAIYARVAMCPVLSGSAGVLLRACPGLLTQAARLAGKARIPINPPHQGDHYEHPSDPSGPAGARIPANAGASKFRGLAE